jgi:ankyrin repeat protein
MSSLGPRGLKEERALFEAIHHNDIATVTQLLDDGVSPDGPSLDCHPLHEAILRGRQEIITLLIQHGVHDRSDEMGTNALHLAALKGDPQILEMIIKYRQQREYSLFDRDAAQKAPIHFAAISRSLECVQVLLREGANIYDVTTHAETLLHFAAGERSVWAEKGSGEDETALLKYLIAAGANVNALTSLRESPLWYAVQEGNLPSVRELLAASADVQLRNLYGETVLHEAAYHSSLPVVQMLVDAGVDVHARSNTNGSILHRAAEAGRVDTVQWILDHSNLTVNETGSHGWTPLHSAVFACQSTMTNYLLEHGADPTIGSNPGNHTALHYAAFSVRGEAGSTLVRYLIQYGADVNAPADSRCLASGGETGELLHEWFFDPEPDELELVYPIHCAAWSSVPSRLEALLEAGADIKAKTSVDGSTPLHLAARSGLEMVRILLSKGADPDATDTAGCKMAHHLVFAFRQTPSIAWGFLVENQLWDASTVEEDLERGKVYEQMAKCFKTRNIFNR